MSILKMFYRSLSSMRTGLLILAAIGLMSAIGSGLSPDSFYQTIIFKLFLLLLLINMTLCSITQLTKYLKSQSREKSEKRQSYRKIGILLLHFGVVLILIAGTVNSIYGQYVQIKITEGSVFNISDVINNVKPFQIQLDRFKIDFNEDGSPSQYYSEVSLMEGNNLIKQYGISVNNPLVYEGIKAYQSSYGYLVEIHGESDSGWEEQTALAEGSAFKIKGTDKDVMIYRYIPDYDPQYGMNSKTLRPSNPRVIYSIYEQGNLLDVGIAEFGERAEIEPGISVKFKGIKPYTVLNLKRDPGLFLVWPGGLMLAGGACLAYLLKNKKREVEA